MKIIIDDPAIGRLEWHLPEDISKHFSKVGTFMRNGLGVSEVTASTEEQQEISRITDSILCFLCILKGTMFVRDGTPAFQLRKIIQDNLGKMCRDSLEVAEDNRE